MTNSWRSTPLHNKAEYTLNEFNFLFQVHTKCDTKMATKKENKIWRSIKDFNDTAKMYLGG